MLVEREKVGWMDGVTRRQCSVCIHTVHDYICESVGPRREIYVRNNTHPRPAKPAESPTINPQETFSFFFTSNWKTINACPTKRRRIKKTGHELEGQDLYTLFILFYVMIGDKYTPTNGCIFGHIF